MDKELKEFETKLPTFNNWKTSLLDFANKIKNEEFDDSGKIEFWLSENFSITCFKESDELQIETWSNSTYKWSYKYHKFASGLKILKVALDEIKAYEISELKH